VAEPARLFTLAEANRALSHLAPRIERLTVIRGEARRLRGLIDGLWERLDAGDAVLSAIGERQRTLDALRAEFAGLIDEVDGVGVILRDLDMGLVDFPARVRGIPIYLCWRVGEARISHWHGLGEGYAGRKSIASLMDSSGRRSN
jgi:hypothetical protein